MKVKSLAIVKFAGLGIVIETGTDYLLAWEYVPDINKEKKNHWETGDFKTREKSISDWIDNGKKRSIHYLRAWKSGKYLKHHEKNVCYIFRYTV